MTTQQNEELPIVKMLEEYILALQKKKGESYHFTAGFIIGLLEEVRTLEQASIDKAKEEFRNSDEYKEIKKKADKYDDLC